MPNSTAIATEMNPIASDRRVPWISRDRMSRPTGSVPSRKRVVPPACHAGGVSVKSRYCSFGGCGDTTSAVSASTINATTTASPTSAPRLCAYARHSSRHAPGGARSATGVTSSGMPDARVHHAIEEVDDEVDGDDDGRDEQDAALHDGVVARLHAVDQPVADARPGEDRLGQDRAGQKQADLQADDRDDWDERVAQRVHDHHARERQALR